MKYKDNRTEANPEQRRTEDVIKRPPRRQEDQKTLHELQIHQAELEMQNEQLRRALAELDASQARYFDLYNLAPVSYLTVSDKGLIREANLTASTLLGTNRRALLQQPLIRFILKEDRDAYYLHNKKLLETVELQTCELRMVKNDGTEFWVHLESTVARDSDGASVYRVVLSDITDRKRSEEEARILQERLQQVDKIESIGTLAGGIAHDFNNLLMGIQGYASLTLQDMDPLDPNYERVKRIEEQVQSGADLTKQLLGFARGEKYDVKPADINDIVEKSSSMFGRTRKEISIHRKYGKDLRSVEVDWGRMVQVFMNLYLNSWQAMPGGGDIYLETEEVLFSDQQRTSFSGTPGYYVKISVTDTGTGMDEKTKERIFDPFFTTKERGRGTGLGLAMVHGIIKGHQGMINVHSKPDQGTTFTIYLPVSEKEVVTAPAATKTIVRGTETILLVDDEQMVREVVKEMLESMGYRVYAVGTGQEAIDLYREKQQEFAMVLLDMLMPGMSGGFAFDQLREINPRIKVLLSSGYRINGKAQTIMDRGCNGFLQKPFCMEELSHKVRELLD